MRRYYYPVIIVAIAFSALYLCNGCKKTTPPVPCTNAIPATAIVGQSLTFTGCNPGEVSYFWSFGDGATATTASAIHIYTAPGTYQGSYTVSDGQGSTKGFTIIVSYPVNVWTFKGVTDTSSYALASGDTLETTNFTATNSANISNIVFAFSALPTAGGMYRVVNDLSAISASQVAVYLTTPGGSNYGSTGRDNASATVTIAGGKMTIAITSAEMVNTTNPADSAVLSTTVTQTE